MVEHEPASGSAARDQVSRESRTARLLEALAHVPSVLVASEPTGVDVSKGIHATVIEHDYAVPTYHLRANGRPTGGSRLWSSAPALTIVEVFYHNRDDRFAQEVVRACVIGREAALKGAAIYAEQERRRREKKEITSAIARALPPPRKSKRKSFTPEEKDAYGSLAWLVRQRFGNVCVYCGRYSPATVDHILPRSRGGKDEADNLVPACLPCNTSKGSLFVEDFIDIIEERQPGLALDLLERVMEVLDRALSSET